jgi:hypothetical protein
MVNARRRMQEGCEKEEGRGVKKEEAWRAY